MTIDRHNYEEFFILYLDNELNAGQRADVEAFVAAHPDLKEEFTLLQQTVLSPDDSLIYSAKESLMKQDDQLSISLNNYEEWLLLYTDNELTEKDKDKVLAFTAMHPAVAEELTLLQQTRSAPDNNIVFADKASLYHSEEKVRILPFKRIAVAAAILLAITLTSVAIFNKTKKAEDGLAAKPTIESGPKAPVKINEQKKEELLAKVPEQNKATREASTDLEKTTVPSLAKETITKKIISPSQTLQPTPETALTAKVEEKKRDNNLPQPKFNPNVNDVNTTGNVVAANTNAINSTLTNQKEIKPRMNVTQENPQPLYTSNTVTDPNDEPVDVNQSGRKNKLRGFFRKVTRTFEKNTNIKATDDDDRLLLGGLAIRL